jgi:hypothetical protein
MVFASGWWGDFGEFGGGDVVAVEEGAGMTAMLLIIAVAVSLAQGSPAAQVAASRESVLNYWRTLPEARPPLPGFRAPMLGASPWPFDAPRVGENESLGRAADLVGAKLARDGLLKCVAEAIETLGAAQFVAGGGESVELLRRAGLPVDLLAYFDVEGSIAAADSHARIGGAVAAIARHVAVSTPTIALSEWLGRAEFRFVKSHPGFVAVTDSGDGDFGLMRLQLTRPDYWAGIGDGGSVDIARQLVEKAPDVRLLVNIEKRFAEPFAMLVEAWPLRGASQISIVSSEFPVAQWARDNGVAGLVADERSGGVTEATITPRYASRGEDGTTFVPGESFVMDALAGAGHMVVQSPLLFQGGDLIVVNDVPRRQRVLLIGESEVWRNVALGLTAEQVLTCFKLEFGVDRCEVLPAASYHIDYQVSVRADATGVTAFVNDPAAAVRIVVELGTRALAKGGVIGDDIVNKALACVEGGKAWEYAELIGPMLGGRSKVAGQYSEALTVGFSTAPSDSAAGNFQHYLSALDLWLSMAGGDALASVDPETRAYFLARRRLIEDGEGLIQQVAALGWKVVRVPSMGDSARGINYLNGLHDRRRFLMPAQGGLMKQLDEAAVRVFQHNLLSTVDVVPIMCAESQHRAGALRCSSSVWMEMPRSASPSASN